MLDFEHPPVVLASASPRRQELFSELDIPFEVCSADIDESRLPDEKFEEYADRMAHEKAEAVASKYPNHLVIAADTVVHLDGTIFGKPKDMEEAREMLMALSGRKHQVYTAVCFMLPGETLDVLGMTTSVQFKKLRPKDIDAYFNKVNPLDKAGAYGIQEFGDMLVKDYEGSYTNVIGLPMEVVEGFFYILGVAQDIASQMEESDE